MARTIATYSGRVMRPACMPDTLRRRRRVTTGESWHDRADFARERHWPADEPPAGLGWTAGLVSLAALGRQAIETGLGDVCQRLVRTLLLGQRGLEDARAIVPSKLARPRDQGAVAGDFVVFHGLRGRGG